MILGILFDFDNTLYDYDLNKYLKYYENEFNNNFKLYDGDLELFKYLKSKNIKIGIVSNNIFIQQYNKFKESYLLEYIDFIQTSDECGEEKPNINIFLNIQNKMGLPFENMAFIGDNFEHDIESSLELKMFQFHFIHNS